ncbi:MAG: hypothetical protein FJW86_11760 [Actinobacteria bacterium]|nr:hypothetical protein [Actinomycetota bacterium]
MGMFKDLKKMSDIGKEMSEQKRKEMGWEKSKNPLNPSGFKMSDALKAGADAAEQAQALQAEMMRQQELLTTGMPGTATVKGLQDTGQIVNFNPQVVLDLEVTIEGKGAYPVQFSTTIPQVHIPMVQPGNTIGVRVDPNDPSSVAIDWARPQG